MANKNKKKSRKDSTHITTHPDKKMTKKTNRLTKRSLDNPNNVKIKYVTAEERILCKRLIISLTIEILIIGVFLAGMIYSGVVEGFNTKSLVFIASMVWSVPTIFAFLYMVRGKNGIFYDIEEMKRMREDSENIKNQINDKLIDSLERLGFKDVYRHKYEEPLDIKNDSYKFKCCFGYHASDAMFDDCETEARQVGGNISISGDTMKAIMIAETDDTYIHAEWWLRNRCIYISAGRDNKGDVEAFFESINNAY